MEKPNRDAHTIGSERGARYQAIADSRYGNAGRRRAAGRCTMGTDAMEGSMSTTTGAEPAAVTSPARTPIDPLARSTVGVEQPVTAPIIVAVDGTRASGAALRIAAALADRDHVSVEAIVLEGLAPPGTGMSLSADALRQATLPESTRLARVRRQLCSILETHDWKLHVELGFFGPAVTKLARTSGASLIVMGLTRHRRWQQSLGGGAVARVLKTADIPILAVAPTARELPRVAVAAVDFSAASLRAARAARDLLARPATLYLLHVRPPSSEGSSDAESWDTITAEGAALELKELASELAADGVKVVPWVAGEPLIERLLTAAADVSAGLIACGTRSIGTLERFFVGHVPLELLQRAECSMLIAPPPPAEERAP